MYTKKTPKMIDFKNVNDNDLVNTVSKLLTDLSSLTIIIHPIEELKRDNIKGITESSIIGKKDFLKFKILPS